MDCVEDANSDGSIVLSDGDSNADDYFGASSDDELMLARKFTTKTQVGFA